MAYEETQKVERKRGEKLSLFAPEQLVPSKGVFVDVNKRLPDEVVDHDAVEKALGEMAPEGMWVIAPDIVADITAGEQHQHFAILSGENKHNQPVVAVMNDDFGFRQLQPGQPAMIPGTNCELTYLLHNQQVAVRPTGGDTDIHASAFLMQD